MSLNLVSEQLLAANGLSHQDLFSILGQLAERRLDYGDLYFQSSYHESWVLEDNIIKAGPGAERSGCPYHRPRRWRWPGADPRRG